MLVMRVVRTVRVRRGRDDRASSALAALRLAARAPARRHPPQLLVRRRRVPVAGSVASFVSLGALARRAILRHARELGGRGSRGRASPAEHRAERPVGVAGAQRALRGETRGGVERLGVEVAAHDEADGSSRRVIVFVFVFVSRLDARVRLARLLRVPQQPPRLQRADVRRTGVEEQVRVRHHQRTPRGGIVFRARAPRLERDDESHGGDLRQRLAQVRLRSHERRGCLLLGHRAGVFQGDHGSVHHAPRVRLDENAAALSGEPGFLGERTRGYVPRRAHLRDPELAVPLAVNLLQRHDLGVSEQDVLHRQGEPRVRVRVRRGIVRVQRRPGVRVRVR
mmetsp:Transcript_5508/g.22299  ORF Transcript_5508/g.22299 Transcript_5508/m.22299 type:complete len:338 (-) Transcript_5508:150-1163(-)